MVKRGVSQFEKEASIVEQITELINSSGIFQIGITTDEPIAFRSRIGWPLNFNFWFACTEQSARNILDYFLGEGVDESMSSADSGNCIFIAG